MWGTDPVLSAIKFTGSKLVADYMKIGLPYPDTRAVIELEKMFPFYKARFLRINGIPVDEEYLKTRISGRPSQMRRRLTRGSCVKYDPFVVHALISRRVWQEAEVEEWCRNLTEVAMLNSLYAVPYFRDEGLTQWLGTKVGITKNSDMRVNSLYKDAMDNYGIYIHKKQYYAVAVGDDRKIASKAEKLAHAYCLAKMGQPTYGFEYFDKLPYNDAVRFVTMACIGHRKEDEL
jgi:hypothetical protein